MNRLVIAVVAVFLAACSSEEAPRITYQSVAEFHPQKTESYEVARFFIGKVSASRQTNISFETPGKVDTLLVDQGTKVNKGDALAQLDTRLLKTQSKELAAQLRETNARISLAANSLQRQRDLKVSGFSAEQRIDELNSEVQSLTAAQEGLKAAINANEIRIEKAVLTAPFSGVISVRYIDAGMVVDPSRPVFQLIKEDGLELKVGIPAHLVDSLVVGKDYPVKIAGVDTQATFVAASAHIERDTQTVPARFMLSNTQAKDGEMAGVNVVEKYDIAGYWIPISAVTEGLRGSWLVYGLGDVEGSVTKKVKRHLVEILHVAEDSYFVDADLPPSIVMSGLHKIVPDQLVQIVAPEDGLISEKDSGLPELNASEPAASPNVNKVGSETTDKAEVTAVAE